MRFDSVSLAAHTLNVQSWDMHQEFQMNVDQGCKRTANSTRVGPRWHVVECKCGYMWRRRRVMKPGCAGGSLLSQERRRAFGDEKKEITEFCGKSVEFVRERHNSCRRIVVI